MTSKCVQQRNGIGIIPIHATCVNEVVKLHTGVPYLFYTEAPFQGILHPFLNLRSLCSCTPLVCHIPFDRCEPHIPKSLTKEKEPCLSKAEEALAMPLFLMQHQSQEWKGCIEEHQFFKTGDSPDQQSHRSGFALCKCQKKQSVWARCSYTRFTTF